MGVVEEGCLAPGRNNVNVSEGGVDVLGNAKFFHGLTEKNHSRKLQKWLALF